MSYEPCYEQGDLVRWYEYYADGDIVRDGGIGIVLEPPAMLVGAIRSINYRVKVYCMKKHYARWFNVSEIDLIKEGTYKPDKNIKKEI